MTPGIIDKKYTLNRLRISWLAYLLFSVAILLIGFAVFGAFWDIHNAFRWLAISSLALSFFMGMLWSLLEDNTTRENNAFSPLLGAGTNLTILRGIMIAMLMGFVYSSRPDNWINWIPGFLFTLAVLMDYFDGYLARLSNHTTHLGEKLDTNLDGWTILIGSILVIQYGQAPWWFLSVGLARFVFVAGIWIRQKLGLPVYPLKDSATRRAFAGAQMGLIAVLLMPLFSPPGTYWAATLFAIPFIIGFLLDWAHSIGFPITKILHWLRLNSALKSNFRFIRMWLPVFLRASSVFLLVLSFWTILQGSSLTILAARVNGNTSQFLVISLMFLLMLLGLFGFIFGAAGRVAALGVLFAVGIRQHLFDLSSLDILLIFCACALFYLGTGPGSLWEPENNLIHKRAGQYQKSAQFEVRKNEGEACAQDAI
jgi:CDP-diacylglycerol---glycerol-3-phosphate 3-phosphatidyltransferase